MKKALVAAVMAIAAVGVSATPCWACSCAPSTKPEYAKAADAVFFGKVKSITGGDSDDGIYGDDFLRVRMRVRLVYKGKNIDRQVVVRTSESGASCGYETFIVGERYTVFADKTNGKFFTGLCSGTKKGRINPLNYGLPPGEPPA